jgi:hypothetical protein
MKKITILSTLFVGVLAWAQGIKFEDSNLPLSWLKQKKKTN